MNNVGLDEAARHDASLTRQGGDGPDDIGAVARVQDCAAEGAEFEEVERAVSTADVHHVDVLGWVHVRC